MLREANQARAERDDDAGTPLKTWLRALQRTGSIARNTSVTLPALIETLGARFGAAPALVSDDECLTYRALAERSNGYARWALAAGISRGDVVGLLMSNRPEYMAIWLGVTRIGGVVSLLNQSLKGEALAYCINTVAPRHLIVGADLAETVAAVLPRLSVPAQCWVHGKSEHDFPRIDQEVARHEGSPLDCSEYRQPSILDRALHIYTSGTTGRPKAANVSHLRLMQWTHWFAGLLDTGPDDRMYNCLPMYHSVGGVVATGAVLVGGGAVVLRKRFSASQFWDDVVNFDCTLFQYIGELCRYLVNSPPHRLERQHRLRLCCGNGLRPDIWGEFKQRFDIPRILEFYASTEGNFSLYNCEGEPGAIGRIPSFLTHRSRVALVKFDVETESPARDEAGLCIPCPIGEVGEAIAEVADDGTIQANRFEGYTEAAASERKLLRNVFAPGDAWFRSGDLMRKDGRGFFYFVDRIGDTFRWKGENVSTTEVTEAICTCPGVMEAAVYGVSIPGADGRAGMAAVVVSQDFDLATCHQHLAERLPDYAQPLFLRLLEQIETTETFKPRKQDLLRAGYDPAATADALYFNDRTRRTFTPLDAALFRRISTSGLRL